MRRYLHAPLNNKGKMSLIGYIFLLGLFMTQLNYNIQAKSIVGSSSCLWQLEHVPLEKKMAEPTIDINYSSVLMNVLPADTTICTGQSVQFSIDGFDSSFNFEWSATDGTFDNVNSATPIYTNTNDGTYAIVVIVSDQNNNNVGFFDTEITLTVPISLTVLTVGEDCGQLGSIDLTPGGGSGNYNIDWLDVAGTDNSEDRNNLTAGTYSVVVTDDMGCVQSSDIVVPLLCNNACPASAGTITPNAGFLCVPGTFTTVEATPDGNANVPAGFQVFYLLTTGANSLIVQTNGSPSFNVTMEGAYTIHTFVYDPNTFDISTIITNTTTLQDVNSQLQQGAGSICGSLDMNGATTLTDKAVGFVVTSSPETCDAENGKVILAPPSNDFEWFDGFMGNERNDLADGTYIVTVTESTTACVAEIEVVIDEVCQCATPPTVDNIVIFEATCGNSNGSATLEMIGNANNFSYVWNPAISSSNIANNLPAGSYSVLISEINDATCFSIVDFVVGNSDGPQVSVNSTSAANCTAANGSANISPNNLTYTWCDGGNGASRNDLMAGTCPVTVTDPATGCINVFEVFIDEINNLSAQIAIGVEPDCGLANGVASVLVSGGSGDYAFDWNDGGASSTRFGLASGPYTITITDNIDGCTTTESFTLTNEVAGATVNIASNVGLNCSGDTNGTVNFNVQFEQGFVQPATEVIQDVAGNTFTNGSLGAGSYCIVVTDGNGCLAGEGCFEVTQPDALTIDISVANETCNQLGIITIVASGGANGYTYDWADLGGGNDPANRSGLSAGTYNLTVTDGNSCTAAATITVGDDCNNQSCTASAGTLVIDANPVCLVAGSATISATPQGNAVVPAGFSTTFVLTVGGVIQSVSPSPVFTVNNISSYTIHTLVYDPNTLDLSIVVPTVTTAQEVVNLLVQGGGAICASLDVTGATVSVINCGGCTPPQLLNIVKTASNCNESTGTATVNAVGNNNDYTFTFSTGTVSINNVSDLSLGTYTVTITDANDPNCFIVESFSIGNADGPQSTIISTSATSCAANNGSAQLDPATFDYLWCDGGTGSVRNDLSSGICPVTVTDPATGCTNIIEVDIEAANLLSVVPVVNQTPDCGMANGIVVLSVNGGSNNYTFQWSDPNSIDDAIRTNLPGGTYEVTVTDNGPNGCIGTATFTLMENSPSSATVSITSASTVSCPGDANGDVQFNVTLDAGFATPSSEQIVDASGTTFFNGNMPAGDYCIEVTDANGCLAGSECFTIGSPDPIIINADVFPTTCQQDGSINLNITGGTGGYNYDWSDLAGSADPQNRVDLMPGNYTVTVSDNNNCFATLENIMIEDGCSNCAANAGTLSADSTNICLTGGAVTISATHANSPSLPPGFNSIYVLTTGAGFEILQVNSSPEFSINSLGNFTIHTLVFDPTTLNPNDYTNALALNADLLQGGGTICASLDVVGAPVSVISCGFCVTPQIQNIVTIESTCGNSDGSATINIVGGGNYTYQWSSGVSTTNTNAGLTAGVYSFTVTDATNPLCFTIDSVVIGNLDGPQVDIFSQTPTSCSASNGTVVLEPQTNNEFDWSDGEIGAIRTMMAPGLYVVTVTDIISGCFDVREVFIESIQSLDIQVNVIQQPDCQVENGEIDLTITGGSTNYTYIWSDNPNINSGSRTNLSGGAYSVTVIDNGPNACESSITFVLLENVPGATVNISNPNNEVFVSCTGNADGNVQYTVTPNTGFAAPATETIYDANGIAQTNGQLAPGNYCIVVTDGNNCVAGESCFKVVDPDPIVVDLQVLNTTCTDPGGITTFATGGTGFLIFDWADLPNSSDPQNRFNLDPGLYTLTVSDQNGCFVVIEDILVQDGCTPTNCPTSSDEILVVPTLTTDSFCVVLESCFVDSLTTYTLLNGGTTGSSIYGSWTLGNNGCLEYTANDTAGVTVDTICVLSNFNVLTDTTCIIVTVLPQCTGPDIIMEDSVTLVTADCPAGADYCLEIDLAQVLNFSLTDNGQPFPLGSDGCNFDTTFFYSLAAFIAVAPNGPYTLTSWEVGGMTFTIDSFQTVTQLVDSMNVWDPTGSWVESANVITGGAPGVNYGSLNIIQLDTGASTDLDVDLNLIPNGIAINLDEGFHELIIIDLVTGCVDTLYADVICDNCPDVYSGPSTIVGADCNTATDLCLDIELQDFLFNFDIIDNGIPYTGIRKGCGFDTLSTCYLVSALPDGGAAGPYAINSWAVNGVTFASNFSDLNELLNLMNGWDPNANWVLDATAGTICGGTPGTVYGEMDIIQTNTGAIALLEPDYVILTFASAIELDTGFHQIILIDTIAGCTDTLNITVDCDVVTGGVDTLIQVMVSTTDTLCFNTTDTIVNAINLCPDLADGNVAGFGFIPNTNCIEYTGSVIGLDTFCMVFEYIDGTFDTTGIVIEVVPQLLSGDTIPIGVLLNFTETYCIDTSVFLAPLDTIYNYCENSSGTFADVSIIEPNCIEVMGVNVGGLDTACVVICDTTGFCDTTIFLIDITIPTQETIFDTTAINMSGTFCPDTTQLWGTIISMENICDSLSGTSANFTIDPITFCVDYEPITLGTDTACLIFCDDLGVCDTTNYILTVTFPQDTVIAVDDDTITTTISPVTIDIFGNDVFDPNTGTFGIISGVSHGTLVTNPDFSFTYLAEPGFCGDVDSFTYFISNGTISDTATVTIEVLCDDISVFNGFSPNNDGINETLVIQGIDNFSNNTVWIFNRWGNRVFFQEGYTNSEGWGGTFDGKDLPDGTYFYIIEDGEGGKITGWLQISR